MNTYVAEISSSVKDLIARFEELKALNDKIKALTDEFNEKVQYIDGATRRVLSDSDTLFKRESAVISKGEYNKYQGLWTAVSEYNYCTFVICGEAVHYQNASDASARCIKNALSDLKDIAMSAETHKNDL